MKLKEKVCIVTGGARGIGFAIAKSLNDYGADVIIVDINEEGAKKAAENLKGNCHGYGLDVSKVKDIEKFFDRITADYKKIDVLVNNAGILHTSKLEDVTETEWDRVMAINLKGPFFMCQNALRYMRQVKYGRIINISSLAGRNGGFETGCGYSSSKAGIIGMSKNIARKTASEGITVNVVAPGTTESEISKQFTPEAMNNILKNIPVGRLGKPNEIAEAVAFLASDEAGFITGAVLDVNGGMYMG